MDRWTCQWQRLYDLGFASPSAETSVLDLWLGCYWEFEAVHEDKAVFPADSLSSSVPIVHIMGKVLLVDVD
jgi:hypothetical protein